MESNEKEKTTSDDYWRRQHVITKQLQKTEDRNLRQMNKVFAQKYLEITSANQKLGIENKKLVQKIKELNRELRKMEAKKTRKIKWEETRQSEATKNRQKTCANSVIISGTEYTNWKSCGTVRHIGRRWQSCNKPGRLITRILCPTWPPPFANLFVPIAICDQLYKQTTLSPFAILFLHSCLNLFCQKAQWHCSKSFICPKRNKIIYDAIYFFLIIFFSILKSGRALVLREPLQMNG